MPHACSRHGVPSRFSNADEYCNLADPFLNEDILLVTLDLQLLIHNAELDVEETIGHTNLLFHASECHPCSAVCHVVSVIFFLL